jgi:tetratricopeptide (TPR) repeat protein
MAVGRRWLAGLILLAAIVWGVVSLTRWLREAPAREQYRAGLAAAEAGRPQDAEQAWLEAVRLRPEYVPAHRMLCGLYVSTGLWGKARAALEAFRHVAPREPHVECQLAEARLRLEQLPEAEANARREVARDPHCGRARLILGQLMIRRKNEREAVSHLQEAVRLAPGEVEPQIYLAQAYIENMRLPEAQALLVPLLQRQPDLGHAHYMLGFCYARNAAEPDGPRKAEAALRRALELDPNDEGAACELGRLCVLLGRAREAVPLLETAARLAPGYPPTFYHLSRALRAERRSAEAARAEARYRELNRLAMEESSLLERHGIAPNDPDVLFRLAELKLAQREPPAARTYLERARVTRPGDPRLRAIEQRLHALAAQ